VPAVTVSERLAVSLRALGAAGEAWLAGLPGLLAGLEADWSIPPGIDEFTPFERQLAALRLADGDSYVGLIRHDVPRQALLLGGGRGPGRPLRRRAGGRL
jgi:hypothetical protein